MKKHLKDQWLSALRSGEYKQTTEYLERIDEEGNVVGNCCLGVLCRIVGQQPTNESDEKGESVFFGDNHGYSDNNIPGSDFLNEIGLQTEQESPMNTANILSAMNDGTSWMGQKFQLMTFEEIAYWIDLNVVVTP